MDDRLLRHPDEFPPASQRLSLRRLGMLLALGGTSLFLFDHAFGAWCRTRPLPAPVMFVLECCEHFGTPMGQIPALLLLFVLFRGREARLGRVMWGTLAAGGTGAFMKLLIARTRPHAFDFQQASIWDGFIQFLPLGQGGAALQSFPSGHTACAVGFAVLLSWRWPRYRLLFGTLAGLTACQRVFFCNHFPSDCCCGAAVGMCVATAFVNGSFISRQFDRWERDWRAWRGVTAAPSAPAAAEQPASSRQIAA